MDTNTKDHFSASSYTDSNQVEKLDVHSNWFAGSRPYSLSSVGFLVLGADPTQSERSCLCTVTRLKVYTGFFVNQPSLLPLFAADLAGTLRNLSLFIESAIIIRCNFLYEFDSTESCWTIYSRYKTEFKSGFSRCDRIVG